MLSLHALARTVYFRRSAPLLLPLLGFEWIKRLPAETSFDYLARAHTARVSATPGRGLAFSSAGSLGVLYPKVPVSVSVACRLILHQT